MFCTQVMRFRIVRNPRKYVPKHKLTNLFVCLYSTYCVTTQSFVSLSLAYLKRQGLDIPFAREQNSRDPQALESIILNI